MRLFCALALSVAAAGPLNAEPWEGSYGGFQFGLAAVDMTGGSTLSGNGFTAGGHLGYGVSLGGYYLGGEIDHDAADVELDSGAATVSSFSRLKIRAGAGRGSSMIYGTAGLAHADTSIGNEQGYFVGAGIGQEMRGGWVLGGEILYHNFIDIDGLGTDAAATTVGVRASFRF